jgi:hypothetical protein
MVSLDNNTIRRFMIKHVEKTIVTNLKDSNITSPAALQDDA